MLLNEQQKIGLFFVVLYSIFFIMFMQIHLMSGVISGLLTYTLTQKLEDFLARKMHRWGNKAKLFSVLLLSLLIMVLLIGGFGYLISWVISVAKDPQQTLTHIQNLFNSIANSLPKELSNYLPDNLIELRANALNFIKEHVLYLQSVIKQLFHSLLIIIIGMIIGLIAGYQQNKRNITETPSTSTIYMQALKDGLDRLILVFQYVAFSQVMIALFNTIMTALFLLIVLPLFGIHLPFSKSLILATFILGLIPIIGNLIVNTIMCLVAFTISFWIAVIVLTYLIIIHKIEYILNAKIVGTKIHAGICELLIAMVLSETLFGVIGLVFAPIFYAFLKLSLKQLKII
ncbi:AI-2E family transporter [Snodgrassella sp. ESL0253]|uniref:AI-2E family transporter n=1 Tax=Snodgrassella sp. ESL0253 TaxID=2705031 RepID=UPI0015815CF7|nr:AI-2E family transporter [Snodgrassella sp. ESL0253]NUE66469.1 AI-2E family transporter [Snodgrassella sp. ESL0253]